MMQLSEKFIKLVIKRQQIEEQIESFEIDKMREEAKKLPKKSDERKLINEKINNTLNSKEYILLKNELKTLNYCINTVWYS